MLKAMNQFQLRKPRPPQNQRPKPGRQHRKSPRPLTIDPMYRPADRLLGKVAVVTAGDSGIGRSVAVGFGAEGAQVLIACRDDQRDADDTRSMLEEYGASCSLFHGDLADPAAADALVDQAIGAFGTIDILVNNAAGQHHSDRFEDLTDEQLEHTFQANVFSMFRLTRAALPYLRRSGRASVINTTSVSAHRGGAHRVDDAATSGAIVSFTRSLSTQLARDGVRVNAVAPGAIWTPIVPASLESADVSSFGADVPMGRAGEPAELIGAYVFLASSDSSYMTGQVLHVNGGEIVGG